MELGSVATGVPPILVVFPIHTPTQLFKSTRSSKLLNLEVSNVNRRGWSCIGPVTVP